MARKGSNLPGSIIDAIARMPWWAGLVLASVVWFGFQRLALIEAETAVDGVLRGLAAAFQYVLPSLLCAAAVISAWVHYRRYRNYASVAGERGQDVLEMLSWREFEQLVGEFFRRKGFSVEHRGGRLPDGGVDLVARIGDDSYLVQCKHWRVQRVGVAVVREICNVAAAEGAAGMFVVTSGSFTDEARRFVAENRIDIELITGERLHRMIRGLEAAAQTGQAAGAR
ncbi:MAG: restriction endonuclease [Burkholderiales bacterium]